MFHTQDPYVFGHILFVCGLMLMIAETFIPAFGALGVVGAIAATFGIFMLADYMDVSMLVMMLAATLGILIAISIIAVRAHRRPKVTGVEELAQSVCEVLSWKDGNGQVRVTGEIWQAVADAPHSFHPGDKARVTAVEGLTLRIIPLNQ